MEWEVEVRYGPGVGRDEKYGGTPENWFKENAPGVLNFFSRQKAGVTIQYTVHFDSGETSTYTFTRVEGN